MTREQSTAASAFSEREFYLREFRGRTMAIAVPEPDAAPGLGSVVDELTEGGCRVVVCAPDRDAIHKVVEGRWLEADLEGLEAEVWRRLRERPRLGIALAADGRLLAAAGALAGRLGVFKVVLLDGAGGLPALARARSSYVDRAELRRLLASGAPELEDRLPLLREVETVLAAGVPAVNVCTPAGLSDELFTYSGSGTLFTLERYVRVRRLGVDDYDAAADLIARGVEEGFLLPRESAVVDRVLASGFGVFVEGRYLAGIGALLLHAGAPTGEIVSLYAITRFLGEGVGAHLVRFARERGRQLGLGALFACTTSARAAGFFERQGFRRVDAGELPADRWESYDPARRAALVCLRLDL
ncbi:MAG: GNAT family N-acetyltransferase [Myxococcota bacterium]